jgi:RHS repeat-associated protein
MTPSANITKAVISGSAGTNFQASYNTNNRIASIGSVIPTYDPNGNLTNDGFHFYTWNGYGRPVFIDSATLTYDAFDHLVEKNDSGVNNEYVYLGGRKLAVMDGQVQKNAYVPLPGGTQAVYASGTLSFYQVPDWQGSYRIASTQGRALKFSQAFAPFGESYALVGTGSRQSFAGNNSDTEMDMADAEQRFEHTSQGRWISPDPAGLGAVSMTNPQSWNRYAYVGNNPLTTTDSLGLDGCVNSKGDSCDPFADDPNGSGGSWWGDLGFGGPDMGCIVGAFHCAMVCRERGGVACRLACRRQTESFRVRTRPAGRSRSQAFGTYWEYRRPT